jgi:hypothetical protein
VTPFGRITELVLFAVLPAVVFGVFLVGDASQAPLAVDFDAQYWPMGARVLDGLSPYRQTDVLFPYGAVAGLLFAAFALLPHGVADAVFLGLCVGAVPLTLYVSGVRDWRVYGIVFLWTPVIAGWTSANVSLLLGLGIAFLWRYRDRPFVAGLIVALLVSIKLFVWPLALWLLATRRYLAFGYTVLCGVALNLVAWAVVGFDQLGPYRTMTDRVTNRMEPLSDSILAIARDHGASRPAAYAVTLTLAAAAAGACFVRARRGDHASALLLSITMSFLATPVIWEHYYVLIIVPLAILRPRLSLVWAVPLLMLPVAVVASQVDELVLGEVAVIATVIAVALIQAARDSRVGQPRST